MQNLKNRLNQLKNSK